ncbi:MAG: hypothetical protein GXO44_00990 [Deferribacteres bacterium]|nr:hypothetical protein [Deferribacteres bacterium]
MKIRCKNCGAQYFIKDELITEKGIRVKCGKCGYTFVIKKRIRKRELSRTEKKTEKPPLVAEPERHEVVESPVEEAGSQEESLLLEWKSSPFSLRLLFIILVVAFLAEATFYFYKYRQVKREEEYFYLLRNLEYGYLDDFLRNAAKVVNKTSDPVFFYLLGEAYYILQDERYRAYFKKAAELVSDRAVKGSLLIRAGDVARGLELLKEVLVVSEGNPVKVKNDMAVGLLKLNDTQGLDILKGISKDVVFVPEFNRSVYFLENRRLDEAKKLTEHLYGMFPGDPMPMVNLSAILIEEKKPFEALQILLMARGRHKYMPLVIHNLRVAYSMVKSEKAKVYAQKDLVDRKGPAWVSYQYLLNPEMKE